ncbi:hypothetical protein N8I77_000112 [Diaporthe amygdali]|uniref:Cell wall mannoprotein PIR1-like C-terminal domain-containing protein n=1 Tax=Phomopsis amygdali TaxID=1214568 RepID=A0AAD9W6V9_PHOAM|nr:hypothetical protein N8I77_000112 [Diaporthe amygdali]
MNFAVTISLPLAFAGGDASGRSDCCKFTISSAGTFECPAGQLQDGQIRLNGSYDTSSFCIDQGGGITDQNGFGCIVTDPPTTQFQCDQGKEPTKGFSISPNNTLLYQGSPSFFACPATDAEYNIYVSPNFGQQKCFPITLQTSGCGSQTGETCSTATTTLWQTQWTTQIANHTVTHTETTTLPCSTTANETTPVTSPGGCTKGTGCTHQPSTTGIWNTTAHDMTTLAPPDTTGPLRWFKRG